MFAIEVDQDNSDAGQLALMTALVTSVAKSFKFILPNGNNATFTTYVKKFNSQAAVTKLQAHPGMGRAGRVPGTRELVLHKNYIAIYRVRGDDVEILRLHHAARNL